MGNTSQCGIFSNTDHQFQYLGEENHFLYGEIKHFKNQKVQNQHFAVKRLKFSSEKKRKEFQEFIQFYQTFCGAIRLIHVNEHVNPNSKTKSPKNDGSMAQDDQKDTSNPVFYCNKENLLFSSPSQDFSCSQPVFPMTLHLEYLEQKTCLRTILNQKIQILSKATQNSKINQNILLQLQNKVRLCEYDKIDKLPQKQRSMINMFFNQIQVLRMLDCVLTALYGLRLNGIEVDAVRPQLFFNPSLENDELSYFPYEVINKKQMGNFQKSYETMKKWLIEENAKFHHNWSVKEKELVSYLHPDNLEKLTEMLLTEGEDNFLMMGKKSSRRDIEKQNIFAMGLMILEICLLEPHISSKIYTISAFKGEQTQLPNTKKQMNFSFHKQNLTIKFNYSALQKYLIQMKMRYSEGFEELVELMIYGCSFNETAKASKSTEKSNSISYEQIIERLQVLIDENVENLKSVYNSMYKSKSKSKNTAEKKSRNSSLSRQVSSSGVSNQSLSSSSSLSMLPIQSQQKMLSIELLKKHCKRLQNKMNQVMVKSQLQSIKDSFAKNQGKLEQLISKDEERILTQLNKLNNQKPSMQKQQRFNYRRNENSQFTIGKNLDESFPKSINLTGSNEEYGNNKLQVPVSLAAKTQAQSQEKRVNSTTKTKKIYLQKARDEESLGNSVCQTIPLNKQKNTPQVEDSQNTSVNQTMNRSTNGNGSQMAYKNNEKEISAFDEDLMQGFSSKSELKNLISLKKKRSILGAPKEQLSLGQNHEERVKELKSRELYEIYMKEYNNLVSSQKYANP